MAGASTKALSERENVLPRQRPMGQTTQDTPADYRGRGDMFVRLIRYGAGAGGAGSAGAGSAGAGAGSAGAGRGRCFDRGRCRSGILIARYQHGGRRERSKNV